MKGEYFSGREQRNIRVGEDLRHRFSHVLRCFDWKRERATKRESRDNNNCRLNFPGMQRSFKMYSSVLLITLALVALVAAQGFHEEWAETTNIDGTRAYLDWTQDPYYNVTEPDFDFDNMTVDGFMASWTRYVQKTTHVH